jgi:hypothetical protein
MDALVEGIPAGFEDLGEGHRAGAGTLESAITRFERAVADSCAERGEWPARVAAGLGGAIEFLIANPDSARTLVTDSRAARFEDDAVYDEMVARLALMLGEGAPHADRLPGSSALSVVTVIAGIVGCHIRAGTIDSLAEGDPDLVFLALLPYLGFAEASRWSAELSR